jgi:hypothetical protein
LEEVVAKGRDEETISFASGPRTDTSLRQARSTVRASDVPVLPRGYWCHMYTTHRTKQWASGFTEQTTKMRILLSEGPPFTRKHDNYLTDSKGPELR